MSAHDVWMFNINQLLPSVGREGFRNVNMALLTEGGTASQRVYKHGPPDGGSKQPIIDFRQAMCLPRVPLLIRPVLSRAMDSRY